MTGETDLVGLADVSQRAESGRGIAAGCPDRAALIASIVGVTSISLASWVTEVLDAVLPLSMTVSSRGTNYGPFSELGPTIIRRTGALLLVAAGVVTVVARLPERFATPSSLPALWGKVAAGLVIAITTVWYGWLGHPHNAFPANARFHWVDYLSWDSENFFYAAGRLPHFIFYDVPFVWNGLNAGLVALLCFVIGRQLGLSTWVAATMATLPLMSGNLLLFSSTAEDLMLNVLLLLAVLSASLRRRPVLLGSMLALAILGRPSFFVLIGVVVTAEIICAVRSRGVKSGLQQLEWRFLSVTVGTTVGLTFVAQAVFTVVGNRYFLTRGRIVDTGPLELQTAIEVDGFSITAFSGAFVGHMLWMMPAVLVLGTVVAVVVASGLPHRVEATVYLAAMAAVVHLALHESQALLYYNLRYLTYVLPFLFVASWAIVVHPGLVCRRAQRAGVVALLVLGPIVIPANPIESKRNSESRSEHELLEIRDELRTLADDRLVYLDFGNRGSRNFMAYVLRRSPYTIVFTVDREVPPGSLVVVERESATTSGDPVAETPTYVVIETP